MKIGKTTLTILTGAFSLIALPSQALAYTCSDLAAAEAEYNSASFEWAQTIADTGWRRQDADVWLSNCIDQTGGYGYCVDQYNEMISDIEQDEITAENRVNLAYANWTTIQYELQGQCG